MGDLLSTTHSELNIWQTKVGNQNDRIIELVEEVRRLTFELRELRVRYHAAHRTMQKLTERNESLNDEIFDLKKSAEQSGLPFRARQTEIIDF